MHVTAENIATALFQASPDCIEILDPTGLLLEMNPRGRLLMEIDDFEVVRGRPWIDSWPAAARGRIATSLEDARVGRAGFTEAERPTAKGAAKQWEVSVVPIRDGAGRVAKILAMSRDVTPERQRHETMTRRIDEQQAALVSLIGQLDAERRRSEASRARNSHTEKLRILGRFIGSVVHDINNVLASMSGAARLLRRRADDARTLDILRHVDQAVERGSKLVRQLLDFSRSDVDVPETLDVAAALAADADLLRHLVDRGVELSFDVEEGLWPVLITPSRLQSVLFNLVANARDAIGVDKGHIRLAARNRPSLDRAAGLPAGDWVEISVVDDGPGIPPDVVARLGEPFFTTKETGKGTGLGIPSAFELAHHAGGLVEIDSSIGRGTRITLHLQRAATAGTPVDTPDGDVDPTLHGGATILLAETESVLRDHLAGLLRGLRYTVIEAPDTTTAEAVFTAGLAVDLMLSDLDLGSRSGVELARLGRRDRPELPVVFVAGTWGMSVPVGEVVLRKPIDERRLARVLLERLGRIPASYLTREALLASDRVRERIRDPRMTNLYDGWRAAAGAVGRLPTVAAVLPLAHGLGDRIQVVEVGGDMELPLPTFREEGAALPEGLVPGPAERMTTSDRDEFGLGRASGDTMRGIARHDDARIRAEGRGPVAIERLLLPLSDDGERVTHLLGAVLVDEILS